MNKSLWVVAVATVAMLLWGLFKEPAGCQQIATQSCFNQLAIDPSGDWSNYSFVALSHIRAAPGAPAPNPSLRGNVQRLFVDEPAFVLSLGDLYYNITDARVEEIKSWTTQNVPVPFFNAIGNHDSQTGGDPLPDGSITQVGHDVERYAREFGDPNYNFSLGSELFIFLEQGQTWVLPAQKYNHLKKLLERAAADDTIKNIFLMTHLVIWSYYNPAVEPVFRYRHPVMPPEDYRFFLDELKPLLESLAEDKQIYLLAGDIGGGGKYLQTFYLKDEHLTYIATGMGADKRNSFITFSVKDGEVSFKNTNVVSGLESSLEDFGLDYWNTFYRDNPKLAALADQIDKSD
ncbi:MAG: hypothetical protein ACI9JM_003147 [Halioglobus sp.]|jgi:hypothetical protein